MLLITTSTADDLQLEMSTTMTLNDLTPKIAGFSELFRNFALRHAFHCSGLRLDVRVAEVQKR